MDELLLKLKEFVKDNEEGIRLIEDIYLNMNEMSSTIVKLNARNDELFKVVTAKTVAVQQPIDELAKPEEVQAIKIDDLKF